MQIGEMFDQPFDSPQHASLRETAWMGGDLVEGRYLLGMLTNRNLFRVTHDEYVGELHAFVVERVSRFAADVFANRSEAGTLIPFLRRVYHTTTQFPPMPSRNDRREAAVACFLDDPDATDEELAAAIGAPVGQIQSNSELTKMRNAVRRHRDSADRRYD